MEENNQISKSNRIKIIVITALIFLVSIAGISYAYFTIQITGNDTASSMRLRTANMSLVYNDVQIVSGEYAIPGWSDTKTLTVTNTGNVTSDYIIKFRELVNTVINGELVISAECSASSGTCDDLPERAVHAASSEITDAYMYGPISIAPGVTHTYALTSEFIETGSNQNYNQNKYFNGTLNIGDGTSTDESCFTAENIDSTSVIITNYSATCGTDVIIPNTINGKTVASIYESAFLEKGLTSVVIPDTITEIYQEAFAANQLTSIVLHDDITAIGVAAFAGNQITSVVIPDGITLSAYIFFNNQLTSVVLPSDATSIGNDAFGGGNPLKMVIIPYGVTTIGDEAFFEAQLETLTIPSSVTTIGVAAFWNNYLSTVTIPSSVMSLGSGAFSDPLESVRIEGKTSSSQFTTYGTSIWGWKTGVTCTKNNTSYDANGCIIWDKPNVPPLPGL